jgi:thymidylate synthase ThyX
MFQPDDIARLHHYISHPEGQVFTVYPHAMPGMIGAVYARYSRARGGFREILLQEFVQAGQFDPTKADALIQRILIQYGDDSVQEHESAWLSFEGISNLATKAIEDRRLGAYIEQSSRYVFYDQRDAAGRFRYLREPTIMASRHARRFEEVMDFVFTAYCRLIEPMRASFARRKPLEAAAYAIRDGRGTLHYADCADDAERQDFRRTWNADLRAKTCDTLRILLPVATLTNVGVHANGRTLEHLLRHLYSSDLVEMQALGRQAHAALHTVIPRYVQRAGRSAYLVETRRGMEALADELLGTEAVWSSPAVAVLDGGFRDEGQLAAMLYPYSEQPFRQLVAVVSGLSTADRERLLATYVGRRESRRDRPGRALEFGYPWLAELTIDYGIYRDLHRHRMLTQERQPITTRLGFCEIPPEIVEAGHADQVQACIDEVAALYEAMRADLGRAVAQYVVLFGFTMRCLFGFNDREAQHLLELRTQPQGHRSYRRVCQELYRQMLTRSWARVKHFCEFVDLNDYDWPRADSEARQRAKSARLDSA